MGMAEEIGLTDRRFRAAADIGPDGEGLGGNQRKLFRLLLPMAWDVLVETWRGWSSFAQSLCFCVIAPTYKRGSCACSLLAQVLLLLYASFSFIFQRKKLDVCFLCFNPSAILLNHPLISYLLALGVPNHSFIKPQTRDVSRWNNRMNILWLVPVHRLPYR